MDFKKVDVPMGNVLFYEGEAGDACYLIKHGHIEICKGDEKNLVTLARLGPGDIFGEMALFDQRPRMATAVARDDTQVLKISKEAFEDRMAPIDPVMRTIISYMVNRVRGMTDEFMENKLSQVNWRDKDK